MKDASPVIIHPERLETVMLSGVAPFDRPSVPPDNRQDSRLQQQDKKQAEARRQALLQQIYASPQALRHISMDQVVQGIQASEDLLPMVAPQLSQAVPLLTVGYAGKDIYTAARSEYKATENLPPMERFKKTAAKVGDVTLFNVLSSFLVPLAIFPPLKNRIEKALKKPAVANAKWLPGLVKRHPAITTGALLMPVGLALTKPMDKLTNMILDVTYRPMVEKKKREQLLKEIHKKEELLKQRTAVLQKQIPHASLPVSFNVGYYPYNPAYAAYPFGSTHQQQPKNTPQPTGR